MQSCLGVVGAVTALALVAEATVERISLGEKPNQVTEAIVIVDASPAQVYARVTDYARWPQFLRDITWVKIEAGGPRDAKVRFRSVALEHEIAVQFDNVPDRAIRFRGVDAPPGARATGTYVLEPLDGGTRTKIVATLYLDVVGIPGVFVRDKTLRAMRQAKLRADLLDVAAQFASRANGA